MAGGGGPPGPPIPGGCGAPKPGRGGAPPICGIAGGGAIIPPPGRGGAMGGAPMFMGGAVGAGGAEFRGADLGGGSAKKAVADGSCATSSSSSSLDSGTMDSMPVSSGARLPISRRFFRGGACGGAKGEARLAPPPTGGRLGLRPPPPPEELPAISTPSVLGGGGLLPRGAEGEPLLPREQEQVAAERHEKRGASAAADWGERGAREALRGSGRSDRAQDVARGPPGSRPGQHPDSPAPGAPWTDATAPRSRAFRPDSRMFRVSRGRGPRRCRGTARKSIRKTPADRRREVGSRSGVDRQVAPGHFRSGRPDGCATHG